MGALETNIYAAATKEFRDLDRQKQLTAPFDFLLDTIKSAVIVVRGADAISPILQKGLLISILAAKRCAVPG